MNGCICCHGPTDHLGNCFICDAPKLTTTTSAMTDPAIINAALAEFEGWTWLDPEDDADGCKCLSPDGARKEAMPTYTTSLDACAEVEARLTDEQVELYDACLDYEIARLVIARRDAGEPYRAINDRDYHASALQRATALYTVIKS